MTDSRFRWAFLLLGTMCPVWTPLACSGQEILRLENVVVSYRGVRKEYAEAIGRTVAAARSVAAEQFGFDMPETITVTVTLDPKASVRLFNDGQDRFSLTVRSERDLRQPRASGIFHLYGLCHEVGHLAMYRPIRDHSWMTSAAAEGWAHYLGSRLIDEVYAREGKDLWPDRYDYIADGMKRLQRQLASPKASPVAEGAGVWKDLIEIVGDKGAAPIFAAWGKTSVDATDPGKALGKVLLASSSDKRVADWWKQAEGRFIFKRPKSSFVARTATRDQLAGQPRELAHDDGRQAGTKSIAGGGHAVRFQTPGDSSYVTSVRIYGSRYGRAAAPQEDFHVWLCDENFKPLADFRYPYSNFMAGRAGWVTLRVRPTEVPAKFIVCVGFNPTASKGVFVGHDADGSGNSLTGLPGGRSRPLSDGNWMIRVTVDQLKGADALKGGGGEEAAARSEPAGESTGRTGEAEDLAGPSVVDPGQLSRQLRRLAHDDGRQAGRRSIAGGGHAVRFQAPGEHCYLTSVRIYGARYGRAVPPEEDFHVWLCDEDFNRLADFQYPYSEFRTGPPRWVTLSVRPTEVPAKFIVCVGFNPTASKGVFVGHDKRDSGNSLIGLPGGRARPFADGDWMLQATVGQLKNAAGQTRKWTDSTGSFHVQAEYLGLEDGKVRLKKSNGSVITVPLERLSKADQEFVRQTPRGKF